MTTPNILPSYEYLHECFTYEPDTGNLYWKHRPEYHFDRLQSYTRSITLYSGKIVNTKIAKNGYFYPVKINGQSCKLHRIIYKMYHNIDAGDMYIDHIDHNRTNNKIDNLRVVDCSGNSLNARRTILNKSGTTGVFWVEVHKKWCASIRVSGIYHWLGSYDDIKDAINARNDANIRFKIHENHGGEFERYNY